MKRFITILFIHVFCSLSILAQKGYLDSTLRLTVPPPQNILNLTRYMSIVNLPSGDVLLSGRFKEFKTHECNGLVKMFSDGTIDTTFLTSSFDDEIYIRTMSVSDSLIYIAGEFDTYRGHPTNNVARLFLNGEVDTTFSLSNYFQHFAVQCMEILNDGELILGGWLPYSANFPDHGPRLIKVSSHGEILINQDQIQLRPNVIKKLNDNIYVGYSNILSNFLASTNILKKFSINLEEDLDFIGRNAIGFPPNNNFISDLIPCEDTNTLLVTGRFLTYQNLPSLNAVRIFENGHRDFTFSAPSIAIGNYTSFIVGSSKSFEDGYFLCGRFDLPNQQGQNLIRVKNNGSLDTTFSIASKYKIVPKISDEFSPLIIGLFEETEQLLVNMNLTHNIDIISLTLTQTNITLLNNDGSFDESLEKFPDFGRTVNINAIYEINDMYLINGNFFNLGSSQVKKRALISKTGQNSSISFNSYFLNNSRPYTAVSPDNFIYLYDNALRKLNAEADELSFINRSNN